MESVLGRRRGEELTRELSKQVRAAAFGAAAAIARFYDSDEEDAQYSPTVAGAGIGVASVDGDVFAAAAAYTLVVDLPDLHIPHFRRPDAHRNRAQALEFIRSWDDVMFQRQLRLTREDFANVLIKISDLVEPNEEMARRAHSSCVCGEL